MLFTNKVTLQIELNCTFLNTLRGQLTSAKSVNFHVNFCADEYRKRQNGRKID